MRFPQVSFRLLFPLLILGWMGLHVAVDLWLFGSDAAVWPAIRLHLIVEFFLLSAFLAGLALITYRRVTRRVQWLEEESGRIERGESPREELEGQDSIAKLSLAMRRMATRTAEFWKVINEHAIVATTDAQGRITFANDKFCTISGYRREELLGNTHRMVNSGKHPASFFSDMWRTIGAGEVWSGEIQNATREGIPYFVATTIVPCQRPGAKPHEYISIRTDVTAFKAAEERMRQLSLELQRKNGDLNAFLNALTHDLRGPLLNVQGFAGELSQLTEEVMGILGHSNAGPPPPQEQLDRLGSAMSDAVRFIRAGAGKMTVLLNGLISLSRSERSDEKLVAVDASAVLRESLAAMQFQLEQTDAVVTMEPLPACVGDRLLLGQVFCNLIENAIKYRDSVRPLQVAVTGGREDGQCVYRFVDNGIGISPENQERIFDLFHRVHPDIGSGLGLGLTIVRRAVDRMGGTIRVESNPGGGSVFSVFLKGAGENPAGPLITEM